MIKFGKESGFTAILLVVTVSLVVTSMVILTSLISIGSTRTIVALSDGEIALRAAESCVEDSLMILQKNPNYSGGKLIYPSGECDVSVSGIGGEKTITAFNSSGGYERKIEVVIFRPEAGEILIRSWKEI